MESRTPEKIPDSIAISFPFLSRPRTTCKPSLLLYTVMSTRSSTSCQPKPHHRQRQPGEHPPRRSRAPARSPESALEPARHRAGRTGAHGGLACPHGGLTGPQSFLQGPSRDPLLQTGKEARRGEVAQAGQWLGRGSEISSPALDPKAQAFPRPWARAGQAESLRTSRLSRPRPPTCRCCPLPAVGSLQSHRYRRLKKQTKRQATCPAAVEKDNPASASSC